jgi:hypothetical protein
LKLREFDSIINALLADDLSSSRVQKKYKSHVRGFHFPCIMGHQRQYKKVGADEIIPSLKYTYLILGTGVDAMA